MKQDQHFVQLQRVLQEAEEATACRIHLVFQKEAPGYALVSLVAAAMMTVIASMLMITLGMTGAGAVFLLQTLCFTASFAACYLTKLKYALTPDFAKQTLAHYSLGQVLKRMNETGNHANVLVLVSQLEVFAKVIPSQTVANQVPASVWTAINNSLMIDVGHGEGARGLKNSTSAISKLLKVYFPKSADTAVVASNRLEIHA